MNMLEKIQFQLEHLSKSERKVAEVILASPAQAIHSSIAALAQEAGVSEPTVNRFCRSLETRGFPDFKLHLAQSLANGTPYVNRNVDEDDSVDAYTAKIFESAMASLDHVRQSLDMSSVNRAVDLLTQAKRIAFFGLGSSAAVAHERLQIILTHERNGRTGTPDYLPALQKELLAVISKYVAVSAENIKVQLERQDQLEVLEVNIVLPDSRG